GRRGRGIPESKFVRQEEPRESREPERPVAPADARYQPIILPGESISKYQHLSRAVEEKPWAATAEEQGRVAETGVAEPEQETWTPSEAGATEAESVAPPAPAEEQHA